jgi:hypothetical protein
MGTFQMRTSMCILLAAFAACVAPHGCSGSAEAPVSDAGADTRPVADAQHDASGIDHEGGVDAGGCPPLLTAPDGWEAYQDYGRCCALAVPSERRFLPPPVQWEPCGADLGGIECRQTKRFWEGPYPTLNGGVAYVDTEGKAYISSVREMAEGRYSFIAEADGDVLSAVLSADRDKCLVTAATQSFTEGRYIHLVVEDMQSPNGGYIGGGFADVTPTAHHRWRDGLVHDFYLGTPGIVDVSTSGSLDLLSWPSGELVRSLASPGTDNGFDQHGIGFHAGSTLAWTASAGFRSKVRMWTTDSGTVDLIDYGTVEPPHGASELATDGKHMFWVEGSGRWDGAVRFDSVSYMTAPFTTDPSQLIARRVRAADNSGFGGGRTVVFCGRAARSRPWGIEIVRLSDGQAWRLQHQSGWGWISPYGLSCTELWTLAGPSSDQRVVRVKLDSLGDGVPAD